MEGKWAEGFYDCLDMVLKKLGYRIVPPVPARIERVEGKAS